MLTRSKAKALAREKRIVGEKAVATQTLDNSTTDAGNDDVDSASDAYTQLCVWQGAPLAGALSMRLLSEAFGYRVRLADDVRTLPGHCGSGGQRDVFFYVHNDDVGRFATHRFVLLRDSSGTTYARRTKPEGVSATDIEDFYRSHDIQDARVILDSDDHVMLALTLFDTGACDNDDKQAQAMAAIDAFIAADKAFQTAHPGALAALSVDCGPIRWWEDVLGNGGGSLYPREIRQKYAKQW